ncbi:MAG TPA: hypothetical protein VH761_13915 [Ilumatobacteraceae bacterium]
MGDIGEVWNAVKDVVTLFSSGQSQAMGQRAFACPQGVQPGGLDWSNAQEGSLQYSVNFTNKAREWFGMSSGCSLRLGVIWQYGGTSSAHPGLYLHDAYLWAVLDYSSAGTNFTVTGNFGDAVPMGNSAELSGQIQMTMTYCGMHWEQRQFDIRVRGNGYGTMRQL